MEFLNVSNTSAISRNGDRYAMIFKMQEEEKFVVQELIFDDSGKATIHQSKEHELFIWKSDIDNALFLQTQGV